MGLSRDMGYSRCRIWKEADVERAGERGVLRRDCAPPVDCVKDCTEDCTGEKLKAEANGCRDSLTLQALPWVPYWLEMGSALDKFFACGRIQLPLTRRGAVCGQPFDA